MNQKRFLIVTADDYGMGPEVSRGILDLAAKSAVTAAVLLVNSPYAAGALQMWKQRGALLEMGWHPCLTLDAPILPPQEVSSLVGSGGRFLSLAQFIRNLFLGRIRLPEVEAELRAQYHQFCEWVGHPPTHVCAHHHFNIFPLLNKALMKVLANDQPKPYVRRVIESWQTLVHIPGARLKRLGLSMFSLFSVSELNRCGIPGNQWLIGVRDAASVSDPSFLLRWLKVVPGRVVELTCHPGYFDKSLIGRDCSANDGWLKSRVQELNLLSEPRFLEMCHEQGFELVSHAQFLSQWPLR